MIEISDAATEAKRATLSRELSEFLIELSIGVHRYAMYPPGHPSLAPVVENIVGRLSELFEDRRTLSIGVAQKQLVIEGVATEQKHPVLSDLARRLHEHQLGAVSFSLGVQAREVEGMLGALAEEHEREGTPLGLRSSEEFPQWEHARLYRVGYAQLELAGDVEGSGGELTRADQLWLGLAQAALATDTVLTEAPDATLVAESITTHRKEAAYDQVIVGYLLQLADELKGEGHEAAKVRERVSNLVKQLDETTLTRLVDMGGNWSQRKRFLLDANQSLAVDAVVKVVDAAAKASDQNISSSFTRLLSKLAVHAERGRGHVRSQADTALRENVEELIRNWELKDPNPQAYTAILDAMSHAAPVFQSPDREDDISGPHRLVEMALEVDAYGPTVTKAVMDMMEAGETRELLHLVEHAPPGNRVAGRIRKHLTSPAEFRRIISAGQLEENELALLVDEMGAAAVDPLLDVLADSDSRSVRRRVFDLLTKMGPFVGQRAMERLADGRWFVLRNMLALLARLEHVPEGFDPRPYIEHADLRVRREAFPLALHKSGLRERVLVSALSDTDERLVRMGLLEIRDRVPDPVLPTLVNRVLLADGRSDEIRALGAQCLRGTRAPLALKALLDVVSDKGALFGRVKLAQTTPAVVAAMEALAAAWPEDERASRIIQLATKSKDPAIRGAVRHGTTHRTDQPVDKKEDTA